MWTYSNTAWCKKQYYLIFLVKKTIHIGHTIRSNNTSPGLKNNCGQHGPSVNLAVMHTKEILKYSAMSSPRMNLVSANSFRCLRLVINQFVIAPDIGHHNLPIRTKLISTDL
jgi:hypothetical protein